MVYQYTEVKVSWYAFLPWLCPALDGQVQSMMKTQVGPVHSQHVLSEHLQVRFKVWWSHMWDQSILNVWLVAKCWSRSRHPKATNMHYDRKTKTTTGSCWRSLSDRVASLRVFFVEVTNQRFWFHQTFRHLTAAFIIGNGLQSVCVICVKVRANDEWDKIK